MLLLFPAGGGMRVAEVIMTMARFSRRLQTGGESYAIRFNTGPLIGFHSLLR